MGLINFDWANDCIEVMITELSNASMSRMSPSCVKGRSMFTSFIAIVLFFASTLIISLMANIFFPFPAFTFIQKQTSELDEQFKTKVERKSKKTYYIKNMYAFDHQLEFHNKLTN